MTWTPTQVSVTGRFTPPSLSPPQPQPPLPPARLFERALTFAAMGFHEVATKAVLNVTARAPAHAPAWRKLAELMRLAGKDSEANAASARAAGLGEAWPPAADHRSAAEIDLAEKALRERMADVAAPAEQVKALRVQLRADEVDVTAMRLLGQLKWRGGDLATARAIFERTLDLAPAYEGARADLAQVLRALRENSRALAETTRLIAEAPANAGYRALHVDALRALGDLGAAIPVIEQLIASNPTVARFRCVLAQALHFAGRPEDSARAYRTCLELQPGMGEAYLGLAELRGGFVTADDIAEMRRRLRPASPNKSDQMLTQYALGQALEHSGDFAGRPEDSARAYRTCLELQPGMGEAYLGLAELRGGFVTADDIAEMGRRLRAASPNKSDQMLTQYALGQALEHSGDFAGGFAAYEAGAALARYIAASEGEAYIPAEATEQVRRRRNVFSAAALAARPAPAAERQSTPIFVLGMPRAGSTLVEQIFASHSRVEATVELPVLGAITRELSLSRRMVNADAYPECMKDLSKRQLEELGARYIQEAAAYRKTDRPYFVDKRPWNWLDAGLIAMILPHAKIVDIRREPIAACFAMYKQMLADDAGFSYDFNDLAEYYTQYTGMMAHYRRAMPGQIHFLQYERLVEDTETEIRRLLDYCDLPFEEGCLRFWENNRAVATPSAEQVRRPIYREALQQWRKFEPWLDPLKDALRAAEAAAAAAPHPPGYEQALTLAAMSLHEAAIDELREITARAPAHPGAWRKLAELLRLAGQDREANDADAAADRGENPAPGWRSTHDPRSPAQLDAAERALQEPSAGMDRAGQMDAVRERLFNNPIDAAATRLLSRLEWQDGDEVTALSLLERTLEISPWHHVARANLVGMLTSRNFFGRAVEQSTILVRQAPHETEYLALHSNALKNVGDNLGALAVLEPLLREHPRHLRFWFDYGQLMHIIGRRDEAERAFRTCLEISPTMGEAYWGLADLKSGILTQADVATMRERLAESGVEPSSRMYIYYALGHALERTGDFAASFTAYRDGARLFRGFFLSRGDAYSEEVFVDRVRSLKRVHTAENLARRAAPRPTAPATTPIFIVGMPRAGSTLVEQILASHSQVEGTRELPVMGGIMRDLMHSRRMITPFAYPDCVLDLSPAQLAAIGERYIEEARVYRKTDHPYFTDKRPWNWMEAGLIHLTLPHAKIIDARREPMSACFAMFKQVLTDSADFTYDLHDLGRNYTEYVGLMDHYRAAMPDRIHFLKYERLVDDTEIEIRRLLDYCGLPFEPACLRFWETERAVFTPSAEQVRTPIFRDAMQQWRNYEPWLGPLKAAVSMPAKA